MRALFLMWREYSIQHNGLYLVPVREKNVRSRRGNRVEICVYTHTNTTQVRDSGILDFFFYKNHNRGFVCACWIFFCFFFYHAVSAPLEAPLNRVRYLFKHLLQNICPDFFLFPRCFTHVQGYFESIYQLKSTQKVGLDKSEAIKDREKRAYSRRTSANVI